MNPYNARLQWIADALVAFNATVGAAYGCDAGISDDNALRDLLANKP